MSGLWWDRHRLLKLGSRGKDVERLKVALNGWRSEKLIINEIFDQVTELGIKEFQKNNMLIDDGIAGTITQSMIFESNYSFSIQRPSLVLQSQFLCWAAALEAVLFSTWRGNRKIQTVNQLREKYKEHLTPRGDITIPGIDKVFRDLRVRGVQVKGSDLRIERIQKFLNSKQKQVLIIDHLLGGSVAHSRVIYGVSVKAGIPELIIMDPLRGFTTLSFDVLQASHRPIVLAIPAL
jgi:hypothetical protein